MNTDDVVDETPLRRMMDAARRCEHHLADQLADELRESMEPGTDEHAAALVQLARSATDAGRAGVALELALEAHAWVDVLPADRRLAVLYTLTVIYNDIGDREKTLEFSNEVIDVALADGRADHIFYAYNNLGYTYLLDGLPALAQEYFELSRPYAESQRETAFLMRNLSQVLIDTGRLDLAADYAERAMTSARECGDAVTEQYAIYSQAQIAARLGERGRAIDLYQSALEPAPRLDLRVLCRSEMAELHRTAGDLDAAIASLELLRVELDGGRRRSELARCHELMAEIHREAGRLESAFEALEAAYRLHADVRDERAEQRAQALDVEHRLEVLHHESALLRRQNDELARLNDVVRELSIRDDLTGLYNRRHLFEQGEELVNAARHAVCPLSVAMVDIDHFKRVNDDHGHAVGDGVLGLVARVLESGVRGADFVARYGGEEFVVVMPGTALDDAVLACERIRTAVGDADWNSVSPGLLVSVSVGVAELAAGATWSAVLGQADAQLYRAKQSGRDRVVAPDGPAT